MGFTGKPFPKNGNTRDYLEANYADKRTGDIVECVLR